MRNKLKEIIVKIIKFVLFFGIGIICIYLCVNSLTDEQMSEMKDSALVALQGNGWVFLLCAFAVGVLSDYVRALRNRQLLQPLGYEVRRSSAFFSVMVCYICNLVLPRVGEVLRCTFLHTYERVPFQKTLGTVVTERAVDLIFLVIVLVSAILLNTGILSAMVVDPQGTTLGAKFASFFANPGKIVMLAVIAFAVVALIYLAYRFREKLRRFKGWNKIENFFVGLWQGLISIKDLKQQWLFWTYSLLIWILYFSEALFCCQAFPFLNHIGVLAVYTVFAMGNIGFLVAPGGIGSYALIVSYALLLYNVPLTQGLAVGWMGWAIQTLMVLVVGTIALIAAALMKRKVVEPAQE